jgi:hypothetical protein
VALNLLKSKYSRSMKLPPELLAKKNY